MSGSLVTALLPLLRYNSNTAAMMKHAVHITQKAVGYLNPDQVPVMISGPASVCTGKTGAVALA